MALSTSPENCRSLLSIPITYRKHIPNPAVSVVELLTFDLPLLLDPSRIDLTPVFSPRKPTLNPALLHSRRPNIFPWEKSVWKHVMCFQCVFPTPGDQIFFLRKNLYGNTSCVSNVFFLKKNVKIFNRKNIIKMNHFIHIFFLQKMVYFTEKKCVKNDLFLNFGKNVTFF
jgi:hypothetical protein